MVFSGAAIVASLALLITAGKPPDGAVALSGVFILLAAILAMVVFAVAAGWRLLRRRRPARSAPPGWYGS
jgi:hypothetical protein